MTKRFKVKVEKHISDSDYYTIKYSYGYITLWHTLEEYYEHSKVWNTLLLGQKKAVIMAKSFQSIEDIHSFIEENMAKVVYIKPWISKIIVNKVVK